MSEYDDIINVKRPLSKRKKMDIIERASIFNPFAALAGYAEAINETGRIVEKKFELTEDLYNDLNDKLNYLSNNSNIEISVIYFIKDKNKDGGTYKYIKGIFRKINLNDAFIQIDNLKISFEDIYKINIES